MVVEVELCACYVPVHVDGDDGFVVPLISRFDEEECHGVASGTEEESPSAEFALVQVFIAHDILRTHLI